jgi:hypothetical protein
MALALSLLMTTIFICDNLYPLISNKLLVYSQ